MKGEQSLSQSTTEESEIRGLIERWSRRYAIRIAPKFAEVTMPTF
jgi:hypothetical protein